ncbi:DNA gyrase inhibitor YacG [Sphingomonas sp. RB56-2]|uniref:DNA gyrase inhibitor YacG n=1 Tax=Sphingomonas brevis TaxID=2908206 RepID=A0ABT0SA66_9SPHN|nr:DNA gyrase inhibitor YacG [Sphingomonas brevis]MCL6741294.1 DNA gyrase inhibitor YacG [Sphingomonas brevis]
MKINGCPLCGKPTSADHAPFCSRGCKDRDLLKWLGEGYRIAGPPAQQDGLDSDGDDR